MQQNTDQYIIEIKEENIIGQGGYGTVYKCKRIDGSDNDSLCVKIVQKNRNHIKQEKQGIEIYKILSEINSDKLLRTECLIIAPDYLQLIMERCDMDLEKEFKLLLNDKKWYDQKECLNIVKSIAEGCRILYENKIVHRDIKPQNILVKTLNKGQQNERKLYKISDFDFSRTLEDFDKTLDLTKLGTNCYLSPQIQLKKEYSGKTDIYSYGILFYQIFFQGSLPFSKISIQQIDHFMRKLKDKKFKCKLPNYPQANEIADLLQKMIVYEETERISFDQLFLHPIIDLQEYEVYKIQEVSLRKYLFTQSICKKYHNQEDIIHIAIRFCLLLLGNQELTYCMGYIHIILSDIHPTYIKNKQIDNVQNILEQCAQQINMYPLHKKQIERIKQEYFQMKNKILTIKKQFLIQFKQNQDKSNFTREITMIYMNSLTKKINTEKIIDLLRSCLDQNLQEDLKIDITKILDTYENIPFEKYKEIDPDTIFKE